MPALAVASASTQMRGRVGLWSHMRAPLSLELSACRNQKITTIRQFAFPPLAPTHRSGRLVHKNKKHRKIVDLERFGKDRRASKTSLMDGSPALLIRSIATKRQKSRGASTTLLLALPSIQGAA